MSKTIQKHLRGGGLCVFIRAYNDLDHITPIIYKYKKVYPKIPIDMIYIDHKLDLSNDFRIQFLQKHNIHLICLSDVKLINKHVQLLYHKLNFTSKGFKFNPLRIIKMIFKRIIDSRVSRIIDDLDVNNFIKNNFKEYPKLFLLDQNRIKFYSNIAAFGRQNDIPTVAVPHGHTLLLNELHGNKYMQYKENVHPFNLADKAPFTQTVFENELIRNRYIKYGTFNQKNSVAIGSTRFSDEWMEIIKKIILCR